MSEGEHTLPLALPIQTSTDEEIAAFLMEVTAKFQQGLLKVTQAGTGVVVLIARDSRAEVFVSTEPKVVLALMPPLIKH
jgi:non-ribosomal peptide synthetase component F